jgi:hypothetical protein
MSETFEPTCIYVSRGLFVQPGSGEVVSIVVAAVGVKIALL